MARHAEQLAREDALSRTIALVNDKGGVGKTTLAVNLAGQLAAADFTCLLVDLNRQANLADDLGFRDGPADDRGAGLLVSVVAGTPLRPVEGVRPGLDVVAGGARLVDLADRLRAR